MTLSPENHAALLKDRKDSIIRAGVPPRYVDTRLSDLGPVGQATAEWLHETGLGELRKGYTIFLEGAVLPSTKLFFVMGRGLITAGIGVRILQPLELVFALEDKDYEEIERLERVSVLMVNPFQSQSDSPFASSFQRYRVQEFLLSRLEMGKSHVLVRHRSPTSWWTPDFLERIAERSKVIEVPK